jgi:hypothetical protein
MTTGMLFAKFSRRGILAWEVLICVGFFLGRCSTQEADSRAQLRQRNGLNVPDSQEMTDMIQKLIKQYQLLTQQ